MARKRISMAEEWQTWAKRYDIDGGVRTFESGLTLKVILGALFEGYRYTPVLAAGFGCGIGLASMATIAIALVSKAVIVKPF